MAEINKISPREFADIASQHPFNDILLTKDYYVTLFLYLCKDIDGLYFKGGTALQKIFLNHSRLSEDIDYTVTIEMGEAKRKITEAIKASQFATSITKDKDVEGFTRLVIHYKGFGDEDGTVFIDLNKRAKLLLKPERHEIQHFYQDYFPSFSVNTLARDEMFAEKAAATVGRNRPRDHYDVYTVIKAGLPINLELVKQKCKQSGIEFNVQRMFSKADKLKVRWDRDMIPLLAEEVPFVEVMRTLAKYFNLKEAREEEKERRKR
ncbi:nucleotidyl transferase AbiEii/AbiGii toxin family protein [Candidatus Woesearchaeota archaeon]|nr:nucleotidyl transferase AbiEii/AbiGii toxin family protein [Candidatus Woesearchaeota archaeon]